MRIILLLAAATVMTQCDMTDVGTEENDLLSSRKNNSKKGTHFINLSIENQLGSPLHWHNYAVSEEALKEELGKPVKQEKEITTRRTTHDFNKGKSILKTNSRREVEQTLLKSDTAQTEEQAEQMVMEGVSNRRTNRQVLKEYGNESVIWNEGVFYMFITKDPTIQNAFKMGVKVWRDNTCIDFMEDHNAKNKVLVLKRERCSSDVGRIGGEQGLFLNEAAAKDLTAVHEIGHVLGLFHTMARYDRDDFVTVDVKNLEPNSISNFLKINRTYIDVYGLTYDYGSVMHYGELSGSHNGRPTMIAKDPHHQATMGSTMISFSDIFMINKRYGCDAKCNKSTSAKCMKEGFPHPRNCSICICPSGYGGALCDRRPPGCGEDLVATEKIKTLTYRLGFGSGLRDRFDFCNYLISAPKGKKIELEVLSISLGFDEPGCQKGGAEIKAQQDQKMTGYRFCSMKGSGGPIVSRSNPLPLILYNRLASMQTVFTYRYVD